MIGSSGGDSGTRNSRLIFLECCRTTLPRRHGRMYLADPGLIQQQIYTLLNIAVPGPSMTGR